MSLDKARSGICLTTLLLFLGGLPKLTSAASHAGDYIVIFTNVATHTEIATYIEALEAEGAEVHYEFRTFPAVRLLVPDYSNVDDVRLRRNACVQDVCGEFKAIPDVVPSDPLYAVSWHHHGSGQHPNIDLDSERAWDVRTSADSVKVAIVDWGFEVDHPDLSANIDRFYIIDDNPDYPNHGTAVAGVMGAVGNNGTGVTGVAWDIDIWAFQTNGGNSLAQAIDLAVAEGADIINNSWHADTPNAGLYQAVQAANAAGVIVVNAAGNNDHDLDVSGVFPASWNWPLNLAVGNYGESGYALDNWGVLTVDIAAPGVGIWTTGPNATYTNSGGGTSLSTPCVAGALALIKAHFPNLSALEIVDTLLESAVYLPSLEGRIAGARGLDLYRALADEDPVPPGAISDLVVIPGWNSARLTWTMPGEDGYTGTAALLLVHRFSADDTRWVPIIEEFDDLPAGGTVVSRDYTGLLSGTDYLLRMTIYDEARNHSSAVVSMTTLPGYPLIEVPEVLSMINVQTGEEIDRTFMIRNAGVVDLVVAPTPESQYDWLTVGPDTLVVAPNDSAYVTLHMDFDGMCDGAGGLIDLVNNGPGNPPVYTQIAVLEDAPGIAVVPSLIDFDTMPPYSARIVKFRVENTGCEPLIVGSFQFSSPSFSITPTSLMVPVGGSASCKLAYVAQGETAINGWMRISSNAPFDSPYTVGIDGFVGYGREDTAVAPVVFGASPNPFNPNTQFVFEMPQADRALVEIYDLRGRRVRMIQADLGAGRRNLPWDGKDASGTSVASGVYVCHLTIGDMRTNQPLRVMLLK